MNDIFGAALELQSLCQRNQWQFCFIGGLAVQRWGEPRFTADADMTLMTGFGREEDFIRILLDRFQPRRPDAIDFALSYRVLLLSSKSGIPLDIALGALPFEERTIHRASPFHFPGEHTIVTCSADDLIIHKCFANREIDWLDVSGIIARQGPRLNLNLIRKELTPLVELKEEPGILAHLESLISSHQKSFKKVRPMKGGSRKRQI